MTALRPGHASIVTNPNRVLVGIGVKGTPEAARGTERSEYRTGEDVGAAAPLMPVEATKPMSKG